MNCKNKINMKKIPKKMDIMDFLHYGIRSSWWAPLIGWDWGQELSAKYFAWKTRIKYKKYEKSIFYKKWLENLENK